MDDSTNLPAKTTCGEPSPARRMFFRVLTGGISAVAAAVAGIPVIGYFIGRRRREIKWVDVGEASGFPVGETRLVTFDNPLRQPWDGITAQTGVYVRSEGRNEAGADQFLVLAINCAHLGCPVSWFPQSGLFMCPCHGGVYYADGEHASGPPPRGMFHCPWRIAGERLLVQAPHFPTLQDTLEDSV